jgi:hypothetical protein
VAKSKATTQQSKPAQDKKQLVVDWWSALSDEVKSDFFKRAINNLPKVMRSLEASKASLENAMERPLLRLEIEKLFEDVCAQDVV